MGSSISLLRILGLRAFVNLLPVTHQALFRNPLNGAHFTAYAFIIRLLLEICVPFVSAPTLGTAVSGSVGSLKRSVPVFPQACWTWCPRFRSFLRVMVGPLPRRL